MLSRTEDPERASGSSVVFAEKGERMSMKRKIIGSLLTGMLVLPGAVYAAQGAQTAEPVVKMSTAESAAQGAEQKVYSLTFNPKSYTRQTLAYNGKAVAFRAYEHIPYVARPVAVERQSMNIYIPEVYFQKGGTINGYTAKTAPIFLPNGVGGYMPGDSKAPSEKDRMSGGANASLVALSKGYVVAAPAIRGRTTQNKDGVYVGKAPALIVDYKAAVRYLRHNRNLLPAGDTDKIISNGTSAGGALSVLLGATGNSKDYEPYLKAVGAAKERDDIFAASVYCPITNLEHADMAYEWMFNGVNEAHQQTGRNLPALPVQSTVTNRPADAPVENQQAVKMTWDQQMASLALKKQFPAYVNSLGLEDRKGNKLWLDAAGNGSFADYIKSVYLQSVQTALDGGKDLDGAAWFRVKDGKAVDMDLAKYAAWATRLKATPAFDKFDLSSGENDEFGDSANQPKHFTAFSALRDTGRGGSADPAIIHLLNPMDYIGASGVKTSKYWRIRHGAKDRDTCLAIPAMVALKLQNEGKKVDFAAPWGYGHAGDYDLDALFTWMDRICKK